MIFVTVGTHEQPFDRLVKAIDDLKNTKTIEEDVIIQVGYSTYSPKYCEWIRFLPYKEMLQKVKQARIVITHGGPSSFIMPLQMGKIPIVVPRRQELNEHINNHQIDFSRALEERMGTILVVENTEELGKVIRDYEKLVVFTPDKIKSNNHKFCMELEKIVKGMI